MWLSAFLFYTGYSIRPKSYIRYMVFKNLKSLALLLIISIYNMAFSQQDYPLETVLQKGHTDYIRAYDFSPDGNYVITGGFDNILILWNLNNGKQIRTFSGHTERIRSVSFNSDGSRVLSSAADNHAMVFETLTGKQLLDLAIEGEEFYQSYFSPGENYIYVLNNRDQVFVWDANTGKKKGIFKKEYAAHYEKSLVRPGYTQILSFGNSKETFVIDIETRDTLQKLDFDKVYSQSFSPDGRYIALSSRKLFASVFDANTGKLIHEFKDGEERCDGCNTWHVFSPDSRYLLTMSNKVDAILWNINNGKKIRSFTNLRERPKQLAFSPDGNNVLIAFDDEVYGYQTKTGRETFHIENERIDYFEFRFSPDSKHIAFPGPDGELEIRSVQNGRLIKKLGGYLNKKQNNGLDLSYSNWIDQAILKYIQHKRGIALSPDNKSFVMGYVDTSVVRVDLSSGRVLNTYVGHSKSVIAYDFSPDGKMLATAGGDRKIIIWNTESGEVLKTLYGCQETVFDLKFSENGEYLLSGSWDGVLRIWNYESEDYSYIRFNNNSPYSVGYSPDELYIVTADLDKNIQFWEPDAAEPFRTLIGHTNIPASFDFSPNGEAMVTCGWDGYVKHWNVLTGMLIGRMDKHAGQVYTVKYDPKGRFIASGGADTKVILWNPKTKIVVSELVGHATSITDIEITADGKRLISTSIDGVIKVWDLDTKKEIFTYVRLDRNEWLSTTPSGHFDGSPKALDWVNYVKGNEVVNINSLFNRFYTPGLIRQSAEIENNDRGELNQEQMRTIPLVTLAMSGTGTRSALNADSVYLSDLSTLPLEVSVNRHNVPIDEIRIYNNGKLIIRESAEEEVEFRGATKNKHLFNIELSSGLNEIKAVVVNTDKSESEPTSMLIEYSGKRSQPDLFVLSVGINDYKNPSYNLDYAVNDSKAFVKAIKQGADSLFGEINLFTISNSDATKPVIMAKIEEIKSQVGPEDVFLFYYAGHGTMSTTENKNDSEFYIVTHDVTNLYGTADLLEEKAISASEIMNWSIELKAEKQLFILDACHSGGALNAFASRGSEREKALAQLARNTGTFFLTASQDVQYANEVGKLNHGLFTYALLEMLKGDVDGLDRRITVNELKSYVEERVPELSEVYHGTPQYPTGYSFGRDFPIVIIR